VSANRAALRWVLTGLGAALAVVALVRFPWALTFSLLARANPRILWAALLINLTSLLFKGWSWHVLLRRVAPTRWRVAQEANLVGAAVNNLSVSVMGEAARIQYVVVRDFLPWSLVLASVVWARAVEALALALFMVIAPSYLRLPPLLHGLQIGGGILLALLIAGAWSGRWVRPPRLFPERIREHLKALAAIGSPSRLFVPALLGVANWGAQWATYHLCLLALHIPITLEGSFTALIITNLGITFRIVPGNIGVTQAAMPLALLPFGVRAHEAVAAALALQGIQILPVLLLGSGAVGWRGIAPVPSSTARRP